MCQMCEEYEAEVRKLDMALRRPIEVKFEPDEYAALLAQAKHNGRPIERELLHIVLTELGHRSHTKLTAPDR